MEHPLTYRQPLEPGNRYHIFNRGNNYQNVFRGSHDCILFLKRWKQYVNPVAKTFAFNLLPNHFHATIEIREFPLEVPPETVSALCTRYGTPLWVSRAFSNFFNSVSRSMQNLHRHHGALFHPPFKRKLVCDDLQLDHLIAYNHFNAQKHGIFRGSLAAYPYSSYRLLTGATTGYLEPLTWLDTDFVLDYFGGLDKFIAYHETMAEHFEIRDDLEP